MMPASLTVLRHSLQHTLLGATLILTQTGIAGPTAKPVVQPAFTPAERAAIVAWWAQPNRYQTSIDLGAHGPFCVRLTADASRWFLKYQIAVGQARMPPTQDASGTTATTQSWEQWVQARVAWDRYQAAQVAAAANARFGATPSTAPATSPPQPGPAPDGLVAACGNPPPFAEAVDPMDYTVDFPDGSTYRYQDHVPVRPRFAYYRFAEGVDTGGVPVRSLGASELDPLFAVAGLNRSEQRVMKAVSMQEGGFDSINTYDTGFVSVGFLQFITMGDGHQSLTDVLAREKADDPTAFQSDFRQYGIDVNARGDLDVIDPDTGAELTNQDAVQKLIDDKRLIAVFQHAGQLGRAFRVAQIEMAKQLYWPANLTFSVVVNGVTLTGKVSDVIHSEAGLTTLFDRNVNRGSIDPFAAVCQEVMLEHDLATIPQLAPWEREIVHKLAYRANYLKYTWLSQPPQLPTTVGAGVADPAVP
ncbi:MAG: hypothetical protein KGJ62_10775 [Armatimonadetes bacterium]|nr:hypothetical protein [Armatimonadota bacterium]MDE2206756.1 hypothetical protein [Armatimonadota bacterium]